MSNEELTHQAEKLLSVRISPEIQSIIEDACKATGLKSPEIVRLAIKHGAPIIVRQLEVTEEGAAK